MSRRISRIERLLEVTRIPNPLTGSSAAFLWGARQVGKTTYLHTAFPEARFYDLLDTELSAELTVRPHLLREHLLAQRPSLVVIDEIQKVPPLLEEVHWLLENTAISFILCGSSARKLRRRSHNLLGGRATHTALLPLTTRDIGEVALLRLLRHGALPAHYLVDDPAPLLKAYINNYIKEEVVDEAATRNIPAFTRFMRVAGLMHAQQVNYANAARESGVSASTIRSYYQILDDTLLGFRLDPWRRRAKRQLVETEKFYFFDVGVANALHPEVRSIEEGTDAFGRAFEHVILNEVRAFLHYNRLDQPLSFWRTRSGFEVDLIVGDMDLAIECRSSREVRAVDLKGLRALMDERTPRRCLVVSREPDRRQTADGIEVLPWDVFCRKLWSGALLSR